MKLFSSPYPLLCNYYVTTKCNARCIFCDIYKKPGRHADMDHVRENLRDLKKLGVAFVDFTGGEPLLHPHLPEILSFSKKLGLRSTVTTNTLLYPKFADQLKGKIDLLHFSLDAPNRADHNRVRGVDVFDKVMESIGIAKSLGEQPDLLFTVTDDSLKHLPEMIRFAQSHRLMLLLNPVFDYFESLSIRNDTLRQILAASSEPFVYANRGIIRFMMSGGNDIQHPRCRAMTTTLVISPDNTLLLPCYHHYSNALPIDGKLDELYNSQAVRAIRKKEGRYLFCQGCAISCYFDPSFTHGMDRYFWLSQWSKLSYTWDKYVRARLGF